MSTYDYFFASVRAYLYNFRGRIMIKNVDLEKFRGQYPYGSELFGIYQTLLGWRGARGPQLVYEWLCAGSESLARFHFQQDAGGHRCTTQSRWRSRARRPD